MTQKLEKKFTEEELETAASQFHVFLIESSSREKDDTKKMGIRQFVRKLREGGLVAQINTQLYIKYKLSPQYPFLEPLSHIEGMKYLLDYY